MMKRVTLSKYMCTLYIDILTYPALRENVYMYCLIHVVPSRVISLSRNDINVVVSQKKIWLLQERKIIYPSLVFMIKNRDVFYLKSGRTWYTNTLWLFKRHKIYIKLQYPGHNCEDSKIYNSRVLSSSYSEAWEIIVRRSHLS